MSDDAKYLVPAALRLRLNVWLRSQGLSAERVEGDTYRIAESATPVGDDADVSPSEAALLLYVSQSTVHHWTASGHIRHSAQERIPVSEVERMNKRPRR